MTTFSHSLGLVLIYSIMIMLTTLELIFSNKKILVISSFNYI